ncbi:MAG: hypothetical protein CM15mP130_0500 [Verrucomicrobiota bacterium]|nr:MAG: hypothetical protein CM15mP130_0500 [Verrucomicrobiota bacterium]
MQQLWGFKSRQYRDLQLKPFENLPMGFENAQEYKMLLFSRLNLIHLLPLNIVILEPRYWAVFAAAG